MLVAAAHLEQVVEIALVGDLAEVDAEEECEEGLGVARDKAHEVLLFHGLGKDDDAARFNYILGVLQREALDGIECKCNIRHVRADDGQCT